MTRAARSSPSVWAQGLGYGGLIPFVALALAVWYLAPARQAWAAAALLALLLPVANGLLLVAALLWLCFAVDRWAYTDLGLRAWLPMRLLLTTVASACCIAGALR